MHRGSCGALVGLMLAASGLSAAAAEGEVSWADPSCGYFVVKLPEGNPAEAFGLFSVKALPLPAVGDRIEGEFASGPEKTVANRTKSINHEVIHWANAREQVMLVRNAPVQCASRWKKRS